MDRDFLFGATVDRVPDVFARNAVDRDQLLRHLRPERLADDPDRPRLLLREYYSPTLPRFRRWVWEVNNTTTHEVLARGKAPTKRLAIWLRFRAYNRVLAQLNDGQAES